MRGIVFGNRWGTAAVTLNQYFEENAGKYLRGKIRDIDVEPIIIMQPMSLDMRSRG